MKKYLNPQNKVNNKDKEKQVGKWSDGFSNSKNGKPDKANKAKKTDDIVIQDGSALLIDVVAECLTIKGDVSLFAVSGGSLMVGNKKMV